MKSGTSAISPEKAILARGSSILIIEARYYEGIADELIAGAIAEIEAQGCTYTRIAVPGALEIPQAFAAAVDADLFESDGDFDGAVALGCVIRGETSHYDIVCNNTNHWLMEVAVGNGIPVGNGVLTVDTESQAMARAQGVREGKGGAAARACLELIAIARTFERQAS